MSPCERVTEDLAAIVDGDRDAIARHAEHLTSCDACRDTRHEAQQIANHATAAGADYVADGGLVDRLLVLVDQQQPAPVVATPVVEVVEIRRAPAKRRAPPRWMVIGAGVAALAATGTIYIATHRPASTQPIVDVRHDGPIGKLAQIMRAAADQADGVTVRVGQGAWSPLRALASLPAGAEVRTDERTRAAFDLVDGTHVVLDHATTLAFDAAEARRMTLTSGRIVADVAHVETRRALLRTPNGEIQIVGTRFEATVAADLTSVQVVRGMVVLADKTGAHEEVRAGEEGMIDHGALSVSPTVGLANDVAWSELAVPAADQGLAGLGALRAYKPGESRDRDWKLALAKHDVKVRISGPIARTEITEVFRNDSPTQLEGVYQFPLPADAQIDGLALDVDNKFVDGAFVDKERAGKIWKGVIDRARPIQIARPDEIVWVPGPWRDPALLDWKRGGKFELKIFPIPAKGQRTIKIAYTQVVTPRGPWRQYVYPLPHSSDGSTVADAMSVDVEVRGATPNLVRTSNYALVADPARSNVNALTFSQGGFVPRGDLVIDYKPDTAAELRAWTFAGGAAVAPDAKLASTKGVGIDPKVIDEQTRVAGDVRPTAVLALQPKLPRWTEAKARDYAIVIDDSQSMVGERFKHASELAAQLVAQMDRRDRFTTFLCDSECKSNGALRAPSASTSSELATWLTGQRLAGASDLVTSVRTAAAVLTDAQRDKWVIYVGDGFATTGFRKAADVEHALAEASPDIHVTTIGIGTDSDEAVLTAAARGGGGSYLAWLPGMTATSTAVAALETTYGATLRDATIELPAGLADSAPTVLPSIRNGQEVLLSARLTNDVTGDVVLKGTLAGQPWEQRYPIKLAAAAGPANGFVPRLWASLAIGELERAGKGEDHVKEIALSQAYGVMSRETSLLVLESQAMFDAFGVDRHRPTVQWTGEDAVDEVTSSGAVATAAKDTVTYPMNFMPSADKAPAATAPAPEKKANFSGIDLDGAGGDSGTSRRFEQERDIGMGRGRNMIAMRKVWTRSAALASYTGVAPALTKEIAASEDALAKAPDSREKHRALVQALSYAGDLSHAKEIAARWLERDRLDPQALGYLADLAGRDGERDESLRTLAGLVDLDPDKVALHERMVNAYERTGRLAQACGHRIALATLQPTIATAATAARCLRSVGREQDAALVMGELASDAQRGDAERLATVTASGTIEPKLGGDLVINGTWDRGADLDLTLVAPDGTRVSWQGGRSDVSVMDATALDREELAVKTLRHGSYLVEITRGDVARSPVRGTLEITVLGVKKSLPFELTGSHTTVGRIDVSLVSHLEAIEGGVAPSQGMRVVIVTAPSGATGQQLRSRIGVFRSCYQHGLRSDPTATGRVTLTLSTDATSGLVSVKGASSTGHGLTEIERCVQQRVSQLRLPTDAGTFAISIDFSPN
ncbi:MAG: VIT domain-containing protein [Kofleriaceae bacterium]